MKMIREIETKDYLHLIEIWESAVLCTHDFFKDEDFNYFKEQLPTYFQHVSLFGWEEQDKLVAFMGVADENLEMLFVHDEYRGKGIGKQLIMHGIINCQITKVDVNEQNSQAVEFYKHMGFLTKSRSIQDGQGKDYPILHMELV